MKALNYVPARTDITSALVEIKPPTIVILNISLYMKLYTNIYLRTHIYIKQVMCKIVLITFEY